VEVEWLKKIADAPVAMRREEVERENPMISISRQCDLIELARSSFYYRSSGEDEYKLQLMRLVNEQFTRTPFLWGTEGAGFAADTGPQGQSQENQLVDEADGS